MAASGVLIKPDKPYEEEEQKEGLWYRMRPYLFPALYWNQAKKED
jgi:hypothetical protein